MIGEKIKMDEDCDASEEAQVRIKKSEIHVASYCLPKKERKRQRKATLSFTTDELVNICRRVAICYGIFPDKELILKIIGECAEKELNGLNL